MAYDAFVSKKCLKHFLCLLHDSEENNGQGHTAAAATTENTEFALIFQKKFQGF